MKAFESRRLSRWAFSHYLAIAPPSFVAAGSARSLERQPEQPYPLLDGRLGQVGVAEHEPVVYRARIRYP